MPKSSDYSLPTQETIRQIDAEVIISPNGRIISAKSKHRYIMDILADDGYLDPWHLDAASAFVAIMNAWNPNGVKTSRLSDEVVSLLDCTGYGMTELYDMVCRNVNRQNRRIVVWGATTLAKNPNTVRNAITGQICHDAFEAVMKAIDVAYEYVRKESH